MLITTGEHFNGSENHRLGGLIDIAPTILHLLDIPVPAQWEGISLFGNKQKTHTFFLGPFSDFLVGSRFENWKIIYDATNNAYDLYDLSKDSKELNNVAAQYPEIIKREYEMLAGWIQFHNRKLN